jgi:Branched-chain amino acid ABC-type transport system, permease components
MDRAAARRSSMYRGRRSAHAAGVPAREPGAGAAAGADHDRDLGDRRRPDHRPLPAQRPRRGRSASAATRSSLTWPGWTDRFVNLHVAGVTYSLARLVMLGLGLAVGLGLWLWLNRTRTGIVIRAGVDDEQMTSALGVNIQKTFAIAFVVGSALAAFGAVVWASQSNIASGQDGQWLLNSLVVVIVGGMGSIFGARRGRSSTRSSSTSAPATSRSPRRTAAGSTPRSSPSC